MVRDVLDVRQDGEAVLDFPAHRIPLRTARGCGFVRSRRVALQTVQEQLPGTY